MDLLKQCQQWFEQDEAQKVIDTLEAIPAEERTPELDQLFPPFWMPNIWLRHILRPLSEVVCKVFHRLQRLGIRFRFLTTT